MSAKRTLHEGWHVSGDAEAPVNVEGRIVTGDEAPMNVE